MNGDHLPKRDVDVLIIGGGPCGIAASLGIRTEGPSVTIVDEQGPGGQVATSSLIENVFGVPVGGVGGRELMGRGIDQAHHFGVKFRSPFRAVRIVPCPDTGYLTVIAANRQRITAIAVVLAIGASARRLDVEGVEQYMGRGVVYGAPQYQVPKQWENKRVGIIGGGNSAGQASIFLSRCDNCEVNVFVRGEGLENDMSSYLVEYLKEANNIKVHPYTVLRRVCGQSDRMTGVEVLQSKQPRSFDLDYLLVQIGAEPQTGWLEGAVELDKRGYILTDRDIPKENMSAWLRDPFRYEAAPGIFAGGDAHYGSPNRMSCAVGAGHALAVSVYQYIETVYNKGREEKPSLKVVA